MMHLSPVPSMNSTIATSRSATSTPEATPLCVPLGSVEMRAYSDLSNATIKVKDPMAKGHVVYDVAVESITPTHGLTEALAARRNASCAASATGSSHSGNSSEPPRQSTFSVHRSCVCRLFLEGRCGQARKCKSLHVSPALISKLRTERNVEFDETFLSEVTVQFSTTSPPFAIKYTAAHKTAGLDDYKRQSKTDRAQRALLCPAYNPVSELAQPKGSTFTTGHCSSGAACKYIHAQAGELRNLLDDKQHTPCCATHGDIANSHPSFQVSANDSVIEVSWEQIAPTKGLHSRVHRPGGFQIGLDAVCEIHMRSRCKFGRCCQKLHFCRDLYKKIFPEGAVKGAAKKTAGKKGARVAAARGEMGVKPLQALTVRNVERLVPQSPHEPPPLVEDDIATPQFATPAAIASLLHPSSACLSAPGAGFTAIQTSPMYASPYDLSQLQGLISNVDWVLANN